ncbi:MAG: Aminotransferase, DegT/DnrJ/EryC1/StrS family [Burkholderiaceae bacterium]|jgi:dTDP-4-amino-4,6-dideoxygalactose transaminase|nr:MAG: Aminotransferase, DegT/DnrJ/EryC1/StrS family [Burkholderiaceae bacterium]
MNPRRFNGSFTQQEPIAEDAIEAAVAVLRSGRLHRYNLDPDETGETALLEREYADWQGARYCLACASGGQAMQIALRAAGVAHGEPVLTNAFTLAPVPGAIAAVGARPVLVEITKDLVLDLDDMAVKAAARGARVLMLSNMRGHLCDMERLAELTGSLGLILIEDCAHTMGATWNGRKSGNFGLAGCFSAQTYKHVNAGEGGLLTSDDAQFMVRAIIASGSYMLYERHGAAPPAAAFSDARLDMPNCSARMDHLRAAILRPQIAHLDVNIERWNERYRTLEFKLRGVSGLRLPVRPAAERYVGSSIQFTMPSISPKAAREFVEANAALGVELKWFGAAEPVGFTSTHHDWRYVQRQSLPRSDAILATLFDMRLPLTFSLQDCAQIGDIISHCAAGLRVRAAT